MIVVADLRIGGLLLLGLIGPAIGQTGDEEQLLQLYGDRTTVSIANGMPQPGRSMYFQATYAL